MMNVYDIGLLGILAIVFVAMCVICYSSLKKQRVVSVERFWYGDDKSQFIPRIPRIIWTYWHEPQNIPPLISKCMDTWREMNPDYEIVVLDVDKVKQLCGVDLGSMPHIDLSVHARVADYCRLVVVAKFGGFWIDASMLCLEPLEWISQLQQSTGAEMVGFYAPHTTNKDYPIPESWFFAAPPRSPFVTAWKNEALAMATEFVDDKAYMAHIIDETDTDIQGLKESLPYLAIHLWATVVMQRRASKYNVHLMDAMSGPFKYLHENGWKQGPALEALCEKKELQTGLIKLRGAERNYIEQHQGEIRCDKNKAHPFVHRLLTK
jgi:hypothetical protein